MTITFDPFAIEDVRARLLRFLAAQGLSGVGIEPLRRFTVGFSWVTYGFRALWHDESGKQERDLILRVGPPNGIFGPYNASPEYITLRTLHGHGVPVPHVYWHGDDPAIIGAPFFICDLMPGEAPIPWTHDGGPAFDDLQRVSLGSQFVAALAALHSFQWQGTAVARIDGSKDVATTAVTEVAGWEERLARWSDKRVPMLEYAAIWLRDNAPRAPKISIVHSDYRIGNFLVDEGRITAILDWELVHLGDPVEDLGWVCMQAWRGRSPYMCHFFLREELRDRYAALAGYEPEMAAIRYWEAYGTYKLAVMHYGAAHCFERRGFNDIRMAGMVAQIPRVLLQVEAAMERAA